MKRLPSREPAVTAVQIWAMPSSSAKETAHSISIRPMPWRRNSGATCGREHLDGGLEVERGDGGEPEQHRAGGLAVVLGDDQALLGRGRPRP